jgi:hypothetical protein
VQHVWVISAALRKNVAPAPAAGTQPTDAANPQALSNRQLKKIKQRVFHAGEAAAAAAANSSSAASSSSAEAARAEAEQKMRALATSEALTKNARLAAAASKHSADATSSPTLGPASPALSASSSSSAAALSGTATATGSSSAASAASAGAAPEAKKPPPPPHHVAKHSVRVARGVVQGAAQWLSVRTFGSATECLAALKADGRTIWATNLSQTAIPLDMV